MVRGTSWLNLFGLILIGVFACFVLQLPASGQSSVAVSGGVSSHAEGQMEGVVVSAKRVGGKVTVGPVPPPSPLSAVLTANGAQEATSAATR